MSGQQSDLVQTYKNYSDQNYVKEHGVKGEEYGKEIYTLKTEILIDSLGVITLESVYRVSKNKVIPWLLINQNQIGRMRARGIRFTTVPRRHPTENSTHIGIVNEKIIERIAALM